MLTCNLHLLSLVLLSFNASYLSFWLALSTCLYQHNRQPLPWSSPARHWHTSNILEHNSSPSWVFDLDISSVHNTLRRAIDLIDNSKIARLIRRRPVLVRCHIIRAPWIQRPHFMHWTICLLRPELNNHNLLQSDNNICKFISLVVRWTDVTLLTAVKTLHLFLLLLAKFPPRLFLTISPWPSLVPAEAPFLDVFFCPWSCDNNAFCTSLEVMLVLPSVRVTTNPL
jgi:hypothetical protein